ncbi:DedA family protein [Aurantibacillus circumpalustris]|uniref:DedA family protein n=1 Tax=Aurantibacillus circumpalustris TaxID=3036359 RepID=UPI00295B01DF|nr:DedA family protein [Aurantibacillus circumpalustris]
MLHTFIDFFLHLDKHLAEIMQNYQTTTYFILCLIIFCETGLVATPFLPGDSLLFAAGMLTASTGILNIWLLIPLLIISAILGDNVNYFVGRFFGEKVFEIKFLERFIKREYLDKTHAFYEKHGGKTIIMARFVPIVRTFAPFAAGLGKMNYSKYISFCLFGGILWVSLLSLAGYYLGGIPVIKNNFEKVILGIIFVSVLPILFSAVKSKLDKKPA